MPIIYTYPIKATANDNDLILISDSQDSNKTKQIKIGDLPGGSSSGVSSVTATLPVVSSGGSTPVVSLKDLTGFGTAGQVIKVNSNADGLEWAAAGTTLPGGSDHSVQYKNGSAFAGGNDLTFHPTNNIFSVKHTVIIKGQGNGNPAGRLKLNCEQDSHAITLEGPAHSGGADYTLKFPSSAPANNQVLEYENSTNNLRWINTPTGGATSPAGSNTQIQYNNNSSFGASSNFTYTASTGILNIGDQDVNRGIVNIAGGSSGAGELRLGDPGTSGGTVTLKGGNDHASSYTIKLPDDGPSANNKILQSDASGNLTWINTPTASGISFSGSTANGIATYSSASIANVSSNLTIDNTNKKLNIGSTYSIQDSSAVFKIGSLSSTQAQESIEFHINGAQKVKVDEDGRLVASVGSAANPNLKLGTGNDGIYGTTNTVQLITNGNSKISISDGTQADIQMNDLVQFGFGLRFGATGETLSSYEEGTWTPVMFQSASPVVTATGYYIKIGKKVTAFFTLVCTQGGEAEISNARISGLPFNANSSNGYKAGVSIAQNTANASNQKFIGGAPGGATTIDLKIFTSGTDYQYNQGRWPNSQGNFTVSGSYTYHAQS